MLKHITKLLALGTLSAVVALSSCKDDEGDSGPNQLSFSETEMTVDESGTVEVELVLSRPASQDITIEYEIAGTATESEVATAGNPADYTIDGDAGEIVIAKGQQSAIIELDITDDGIFESDETIELSVDDSDISDPNVLLTSDDEVQITIQNDDEEVEVSFAAATSSVIESEGGIDVTVQLDRAAPQDMTVAFSLDGTALDSLTSWLILEQSGLYYLYDYYIEDVETDYVDSKLVGQIQVPAGATSAVIKVRTTRDFAYDDNDVVLITLEPSTGVVVGTQDEHSLRIDQEDGKAIKLNWAASNVDMDLILWINDAGDYGYINLSTAPSTDGTKGESAFIPEGAEDVIGNQFGLTYNYYEGTVDPLDFTATFVNYVSDAEVGASAQVFNATYNADNVDPWTGNGWSPTIVQEFSIADGVYTIGDIMVPATGSRMPASIQFEKIDPRLKGKSTQSGSPKLMKLLNNL